MIRFVSGLALAVVGGLTTYGFYQLHWLWLIVAIVIAALVWCGEFILDELDFS